MTTQELWEHLIEEFIKSIDELPKTPPVSPARHEKVRAMKTCANRLMNFGTSKPDIAVGVRKPVNTLKPHKSKEWTYEVDVLRERASILLGSKAPKRGGRVVAVTWAESAAQVVYHM